MNITKEEQEKSQMALTIEVSAEEFAPFIERAGKKISEQMDIPGFRKGQAPLDVIQKKVGEMTVLQEAAQLAVEKYLPEAILKEDLQTVGQPAINVEKLAPGNPFVFTASVPLMPEVTIGDISAISVEKDPIEVTDAEIEKVIENLRTMRAKEVLADREAKNGDKVDLSFNVYLDKVPVDGGSAPSYPLVLGEGQMIPGFEEKVVGMKKDEEKEFELPFPEDYHNKQLAGKTAEFKVKVNAVFDRVLPEMDEAFFQELGEFESLGGMKDEIEKNIHEEKQQKVENKFERELVEQLIDHSTFGDIPEVMVNQETQQMMAELEQNIGRQGLKFDDYLLHLKKDRGQLMLDFAPDAMKRIKSALAIRALAKSENVQPSTEEVNEELAKMKKVYEVNPQMMAQLDSPAYREYLETINRNKKTLEWLKEKVAS